jgi:hypothetical protein
MKYIPLLVVFVLGQYSVFSQKNDTIYHQHLVIKFAPLVFFGTHAAVQFGLETNLSKKTTVGFDYAYGSSELASYQKGGSYYDGEVSQRYRLDLRWHENQFASTNRRNNTFWGIEFFNRTNTYNTPISIGRGLLTNNQYNYYERSSAEATYQVWGIFFKYGNVHTLNSHFFLEYSAGIGLTQRSNTISTPVNLGEFDRVLGFGNSNTFNYFTYHTPSNFSRKGGDFLLSLKINYLIF